MGTAVRAVDAPEALALKNRFTLAACNRTHVRADPETASRFMQAILRVLGITWPVNQARHAETNLTVTSDKFQIWTATAGRSYTR